MKGDAGTNGLKPMPSESRYRIQTVYDAVMILKFIAEQKEAVAVGEAARAVGVSMNTAFRMCETLRDTGCLHEVGGRYSLGMQMMLWWARTKAKLESERARIDTILASIKEK